MAFATVGELEAYWRPLTPQESDRAGVLLDAIADLIIEQPGSFGFVDTAKKWVSLDAVKRAMAVPGAGESITSVSQGMADMSSNVTYANPMGGLYLTNAERSRLAGYVTGGMFSLKQTNNARVTLNPWTYQASSQNLDPLVGVLYNDPLDTPSTYVP